MILFKKRQPQHQFVSVAPQGRRGVAWGEAQPQQEVHARPHQPLHSRHHCRFLNLAGEKKLFYELFLLCLKKYKFYCQRIVFCLNFELLFHCFRAIQFKSVLMLHKNAACLLIETYWMIIEINNNLQCTHTKTQFWTF